MGRRPLRKGVGAPQQYPLEVGSKLPLPRYADVRFRIPLTHRNDAGTYPMNITEVEVVLLMSHRCQSTVMRVMRACV